MDFSFLFLEMLLALAVVCVLAVLILKYVVPRLSWTKKWQSNGYFEVVSRFNLDQKRTLHLVKVCNRYLLLGGSDTGLSLITELSQEEVVEEGDEKS